MWLPSETSIHTKRPRDQTASTFGVRTHERACEFVRTCVSLSVSLYVWLRGVLTWPGEVADARVEWFPDVLCAEESDYESSRSESPVTTNPQYTTSIQPYNGVRGQVILVRLNVNHKSRAVLALNIDSTDLTRLLVSCRVRFTGHG